MKNWGRVDVCLEEGSGRAHCVCVRSTERWDSLLSRRYLPCLTGRMAMVFVETLAL